MIRLEELYDYFLRSSGVATDTRNIKPGSLFFCLKGEHFNANRFAQEAIAKGALLAVADEAEYADGERVVLVDEVLTTLQQLSRMHRRRFDIPVLAITGTNGKTTTKELIAAVLSRKEKTHYTRGNFNNHIGVPLTLLSMPAGTTAAIVEMGANHPGEIDALCRIAEPTMGLITNIGKAHIEGFGSFEGVVNTKTELYRYLKERRGKVLVHRDDALLMQHSQGLERRLYGSPDTAEMLPSDFFVALKYREQRVKTQLLGSYNFTNLMAAIAAGEEFGVGETAVAEALQSYAPSNKRSQYLETKHNKIYLDAYNANPTSMTEALKSFAAMGCEGSMPILGDMLELGEVSNEEHRLLIEEVRRVGFQEACFVGQEFYQHRNTDYLFFEDTEAALAHLKRKPLSGRFVLLKGSRGIGLERLLEVL